MFNLPLHVLPPGLLANPTATTTAVDDLERRQVAWVIVKGDERAWREQFQNAIRFRLRQALPVGPVGRPLALD